MGLGPTMQVKAGDSRGQRAFNPQRDLVWGIGRLVKRVGERLSEALHDDVGDIDEMKYEKLLKEHNIKMPLGGISYAVHDFKQFIRGVNDYFQKLHGDLEEDLEKPFEGLYDASQFVEARLVFCLFLMQEIFAEHPFWWQQVKPNSPLDPQPDVSLIDEAAKKLVKELTD